MSVLSIVEIGQYCPDRCGRCRCCLAALVYCIQYVLNRGERDI